MQDLLKQFGSINWVVSLIGAVVLSILANLLTYPIRNWMGRRSAKRAAKRSHQLEEQLRLVEKLAQSPFDLTLHIAGWVLGVLVIFVMGSAVIILSRIPAPLVSDETSFALVGFGTLLYLLDILIGVSALKTIKSLRDFSAHREQTEREIAALKARASHQP